MSHLSILPTVLRDAESLFATLKGLGFSPGRGGRVNGFAGESLPVEVRLEPQEGLAIGWCRSQDGTLALVGDLQRLSRSLPLQRLLARITRAYATHHALREASLHLPEAQIELRA